MDTKIVILFEDCNNSVDSLLLQLEKCKDDIKGCVGGDVLNEYLESCALVETKIKNIRKEISSLQECLYQLEIQSLL